MKAKNPCLWASLSSSVSDSEPFVYCDSCYEFFILDKYRKNPAFPNPLKKDM